MEQITGYIADSSSWTIALVHPITGAAFTPGNDYGLVATFKNRENDSDANAVIQKATGAGITVSGSNATVTLVRTDTADFCECNLHFGIRATHATTGASLTVAERRVKFEKPTTIETTTSVDVITTETPLPFGGVTSYVSDIETLPDYPASFPPASHTHVSADITDASSGGNGTANEGKLAKFGAYGSLGAYVTESNITAVSGNSVGGVGVIGLSDNSHGGQFASALGSYNALFGYDGASQSFVARSNGAFGWIRGAYTGGITAAETLTANRTYALPDASGTVALLSGNQTFTGQIELSGQAATNATSAMTRGLADARYARSWAAALSAGVNSDTNTTTYKTVTELSFALEVGTYFIECILIHNGNASYATSGCKDRLNFTGTATSTGTLYRSLDNATTSSSVPSAVVGRTPIGESAPTNRSQTTWRQGIITVTAAGTLQVQIAQSVAVAAAFTTLDTGSSISITKV